MERKKRKMVGGGRKGRNGNQTEKQRVCHFRKINDSQQKKMSQTWIRLGKQEMEKKMG